MKIITIQGSPHRQGRTAFALGLLEGRLRAMGHEAERIAVVDHLIAPYAGCFSCHKMKDGAGCVVADDAPAIVDRLVAADAVVYGSPLYGHDITAQLKALLDRHNGVCKWTLPGSPSLFEGKKVALLMTCGGAVEDNAEHVLGIFDIMFGKTLRADIVGKYVLARSYLPDYEERARAVAAAMASDIAPA